MSKNQLDLITLTLSPEEARIIASDLSYRALSMSVDWDSQKVESLIERRTALRRKVEFQAGVSVYP